MREWTGLCKRYNKTRRRPARTAIDRPACTTTKGHNLEYRKHHMGLGRVITLAIGALCALFSGSLERRSVEDGRGRRGFRR